MTDPSPEPRRRANGLQASDWAALVDLDPRLSEGLLDRLAEVGVAAYVEPATAVDTVHRAVVMPGRPLDRLWVDPSRADAARQVVSSEVAELTALLAEEEPGATAHGLVQPVPRNAARRVLPPPVLPGPPARPAPASDDDLFAQIVAGYHDEPQDEVPRWPASEDLPPPAPPARPDEAGPRRRRTDDPGTAPEAARVVRPPEARPVPPPAPAEPVLPAWMESQAFEDEGHYVPPPPPPVPRVRARTIAAVLAVVLGVLVLFAPGALGLSSRSGAGLLGFVLLAGGAGALVWWLRDSAPDNGPDDGAVV